MEEIFQKKTDEMDCQPGGPFVIQMLFKNPVELPEKEHMTDVMQRHIGTTECSCCDDNMVGLRCGTGRRKKIICIAVAAKKPPNCLNSGPFFSSAT